MKSKAVFDLDQANNSVIKVRVESTEDVRDKIACQFSDQLREFSNLVVVANKPDENGVKHYELYPLPANDVKKAMDLLYFVGMNQLKGLCSLVHEEIERRELNDKIYKAELHDTTFILTGVGYTKFLGFEKSFASEPTKYWFKDQVIDYGQYVKILEKIKNIEI